MGGTDTKKELLVENNLIGSVSFALQEAMGFTPSEETIIQIILALDYKGWEFIYTKEYANDNNKEE